MYCNVQYCAVKTVPCLVTRLFLIQIAQVDTIAALKTNKTVGLYFSGSWCGPCQAFTPKLVDFYSGM